tara:strand:- start:346 stop:480 length:135 start_codon:yes stop_codon:yes gene_type:complete
MRYNENPEIYCNNCCIRKIHDLHGNIPMCYTCIKEAELKEAQNV